METPKQKEEVNRSLFRRLMNAWVKKERAIDKVQKKISAAGEPGPLSPSAFSKFTGWMKQIATLRDKEREIVSEINEVERMHLMMRRRKLLPRITPKPRVTAIETEAKKKRPRRLFWIILFWYWMLLRLHRTQSNAQPKNG